MKREFGVRRVWQHLVLFFVPFLIVLLVRFIGETLRYRFVNLESYEKAKAEGNCIFVFWHQKFFPLLYSYRNSRMNIMVSKHSDGELIARALKFLGFTVTRGSTTKGGMSACLLMVRAIGKYDLAITPDGPRGPRYHFSGGAVTIAKVSGRPLVPVGVGASRAKYFSSWDHFMLPLPTSNINIIFGQVHYIEKQVNDETMKAELTQELKYLNIKAMKF